MTATTKRVVIVPCSGIGKPFGSVAREAGYELVEALRPETTNLVALSKLVMGEEDAVARVRGNPAITVDGCKLACAATLVRHNGGTIAHELAVYDVYRRHKDLKPEGVAQLNPAGLQLARVTAAEIAELVDVIVQGTQTQGGGHGDAA